MAKTAFHEAFTPDFLTTLFPEERTDAFFEALFGDAAEGAFNIQLAFKEQTEERLHFEFHLSPRPDKCLACNLTYGLPDLFSRHPVINVEGVVKSLCERLEDGIRCDGWRLGHTENISPQLHVIPLFITLVGVNG